MDEGLFVARLALGLLMAAHGSQKLFGWFGGYGLNGTGGYFESIGFRPGRLFAAAAGAGETASGLLLAAGLFTPLAAAVMLSVMIVAAVTVHLQHGLFAMNNGIEVPLLYGVGAITLALTGPGAYSIDAATGLAELWTPAVVLGSLALGVVGAVGNLALRRQGAETVTA